MNRRTARNNAFIALFSMSFGDGLEETLALGREVEDYAVDAFGEDLLRQFLAHETEIDQIIEARLKGWTVSRLSKVNLAILRLAVTEMIFGTQGMDSVVINEAVELAKTYGDGDDYQFVNGLLGSVSRDHKLKDTTAVENTEDAATGNTLKQANATEEM